MTWCTCPSENPSPTVTAIDRFILVGTPVQVKFPPLLPGLYAIAWRAFGSLDAVARAALWLNIGVTAIAAGVLWWLARRELRVGSIPGALFVVVPILTDRTMFYFTGASSEPWMLLGWALALVLVRRLVRQHADRAPTVGTAIALGLALAATTLARTQGLAVAIGVIAGAAVARVGWRPLVASIATTAVPLFVWRTWHGAMIARGPVSPLPDQASYAQWLPTNVGDLAEFAAVMARISVPQYWANTADLLVGWTSPKTMILAAVLLTCAAIGLVMLARGFPALVVSVLVSVGVVVTWPYVQDRFLTPLLPMLGLAGAYAAQQAIDHFTRVVRISVIAALGMVACLLLTLNAKARSESVRGQSRSPFVLATAGIVRWLVEHTEHDDRVMVPWGGAIYLKADRRTSIPNPEEAAFGPSVFDAPRRFLATRLLADSVDVVVIWDRAPGRAAPWLRGLGIRCPGLLTDATIGAPAAPDLRIYRVRRDLPCLRRFAEGPIAKSGAENNNAP